MHKDIAYLEKLIIENKPIKCGECGNRVSYVSGGKYQCEVCGHEELDDFGKVKEYLDENGPTPALIIAKATGVRPEVIEMFLKKGRLEIPEGSKYYLECEKCGCSIRYGRFCPTCMKTLTGDKYCLFSEDAGEKPKHDMSGKMHFFGNKKDKKL